MADTIYKDIAARTRGEIYIGVVGPVRTGKSTFIKKFMEALVLPNIKDEYDRARTKDELPQSSDGKTVMTTEPKFIPDEAVRVDLAGEADMFVKMIDCVGFIVPGALGDTEEGKPRMVNTPWSDSPMPFDAAAELGTRKVITDHCTIAVLVTADGSFGEIGRESYIEAEEKTVSELKKAGKPFVVLMNSKEPNSERTVSEALHLEEKYGAPVALVNCMELDGEDIRRILELVLLEFPVTEISVSGPTYLASLPKDHPLVNGVNKEFIKICAGLDKIKQVGGCLKSLEECDMIQSGTVDRIDLGTGRVSVSVTLDPKLYYGILSEAAGENVDSEGKLISVLTELGKSRALYSKYASAIAEVNEKGYGIVTPDIDDLRLEEPEIVKQAGGYGVRLKASAPSVHMIKVNTETQINPVVGTEQQSEDLVRYLLNQFKDDPRLIWQTNMFGKSLYELVREGLEAKVEHLPPASRQRMCQTLEKIINDGSGGLICIIL